MRTAVTLISAAVLGLADAAQAEASPQVIVPITCADVTQASWQDCGRTVFGIPANREVRITVRSVQGGTVRFRAQVPGMPFPPTTPCLAPGGSAQLLRPQPAQTFIRVQAQLCTGRQTDVQATLSY